MWCIPKHDNIINLNDNTLLHQTYSEVILPLYHLEYDSIFPMNIEIWNAKYLDLRITASK